MAVEDEIKPAEDKQDKEMDTSAPAQDDEGADKPEADSKVGRPAIVT